MGYVSTNWLYSLFPVLPLACGLHSDLHALDYELGQIKTTLNRLIAAAAVHGGKPGAGLSCRMEVAFEELREEALKERADGRNLVMLGSAAVSDLAQAFALPEQMADLHEHQAKNKLREALADVGYLHQLSRASLLAYPCQLDSILTTQTDSMGRRKDQAAKARKSCSWAGAPNS